MKKRTLHKAESRWLTAIDARVALYFGINHSYIYSGNRDQEFVRPRHMAFFMARKLTRISFPKLGDHYGRDHTSILGAVQKIEVQESPADLAVLEAFISATPAVPADGDEPQAVKRVMREREIAALWRLQIKNNAVPPTQSVWRA